MAGAPMRAADFDLAKVWRDEQRDLNAGVAEFRDKGREQVGLCVDVEAAFGGAFGALLRNEAGGMRLGPERNREHLRRRRHLHIEGHGQIRGEPRDVVVGDMTPVLAQMRGDVVGAGLDRDHCRAQRIGMAPSPRVPQRGDVIDVDAEPDRKRRRSCGAASDALDWMRRAPAGPTCSSRLRGDADRRPPSAHQEIAQAGKRQPTGTQPTDIGFRIGQS